MAKPFRFGVNMLTPAGGTDWRTRCRRAEQLGYDVILVPDHLGLPAPFPALVAAAEATERPRVGTFVLNAAFWNPTLLAREAAGTDALTEGRLELGSGPDTYARSTTGRVSSSSPPADGWTICDVRSRSWTGCCAMTTTSRSPRSTPGHHC